MERYAFVQILAPIFRPVFVPIRRFYQNVTGFVPEPLPLQGLRNQSPRQSSRPISSQREDVAPLCSPKRKRSSNVTTAARRAKRRRKVYSATDMMNLLEEAIDRNAARQSLEDRLEASASFTDRYEESIEQLHAKMEYIEPLKDDFPDLERALKKFRDEIKIFQEELQDCKEKEQMRTGRLTESKKELSETLQQICRLTKPFLSMLDNTGKLSTGLTVPKDLTYLLKTVCDCSKRLESSWENVRTITKDLANADRAMKTATSPDERARSRFQRKQCIMKREKESGVYRKQHERQRKREIDMLEAARKFLIAEGLMKFPVSSSEVSSKDCMAPRSPPPDLTQEWDDLTGRWRRARNNILKGKTYLDEHEEKYADWLAYNLYANPHFTQDELDKEYEKELGEPSMDYRRGITDSLAEWEPFFARLLKKSKKRKQDRPYLLPSYWAGSEFDVAPSQASSSKRTLAPENRALSRRRVKQWCGKIEDGMPEGEDVRSLEEMGVLENDEPPAIIFSPSEFHAMPPPVPQEGLWGAISPTLSPDSVKRWIQHLHPSEGNPSG